MSSPAVILSGGSLTYKARPQTPKRCQEPFVHEMLHRVLEQLRKSKLTAGFEYRESDTADTILLT
jgi:hypothetical protein